MLSVLSCIVYEHDPLFLALAVVVLTAGAFFTLRLYARVRRSRGSVSLLWLAMSGLIGGGTIWTTHFVSMLAYNSDVILGYDLQLTAASLLVAVSGVLLAFWVAGKTSQTYATEVGGIIFGLTTAAMHFIGIKAIELPGTASVDPVYLGVAVFWGCFFGAVMLNRISRQCSKYCNYVAVAGFILSVAGLHFTAMTGLDIMLLEGGEVQIDPVSKNVLGSAVLLVMGVLFVTVLMAYAIDIKTAEAADGRFNQMAQHDALTGLSNRVGTEAIVAEAVKQATLNSSAMAVISIGLDRFLDVRDAYGQIAADRLLRHVAGVVRGCLQDEEALGRVGEHELLVVKSEAFNKDDVEEMCGRIERALGSSFKWEGALLPLRSAFGYAFFPDDAQQAGELVEKAERAMSHAVRQGPGTIAAYDERLDRMAKERGTLSIDLSRALERNQLELYYQIQNDVSTREITGAEVLLRWNHHERGMIPPYKFIPIAEETGLINAFGPWILQTACKEAATWTLPLKIAVNVSSVQLSRHGFPDIVEDALTVSGLDPSRLELEITESGLLADRDHALRIIQDLKRLGVGIAMDDFGTGYSSLATLQMFPFDKIKIDREFVKDLGKNKHSAAIVRSTIILAESLDIPVLAEGVETEDQLAFLASEGCQDAQGYLFGRPMPVADIRHITNIRASRAPLSLVG